MSAASQPGLVRSGQRCPRSCAGPCGPRTGGRRCLRQHRHHARGGRRAAIAAGARLVNDVSGGRSDPGMLGLVADAGVPYVCMHWRGHSEDMQSKATYADVVAEVIAELRTQLDEAERAGVAMTS